MSTIISHPIVPLALTALFPELSSETVLVGMACSVVPDLDVIGFALGIPYEAVFGHRGFTHSVTFAALLAGLVTWTAGGGGDVFLFLFVSTLSHPVVDAFTDGGLGIAFLSPISRRRYFFLWRPIAVPPIGFRPFFSRRGWQVIKSELCWIWLPSAGLFTAVHALRWVG